MRNFLLVMMLMTSVTIFAKDVCPNPPLNINLATFEQLESLPYIGRKKAEAIIEYRKKKKFYRITQLMDVDGIGSGTLKKIKTCITVNSLKSHTVKKED